MIFGYNFTSLQKQLTNSHTTLELKKDKLANINVKEILKLVLLGTLVFFGWVTIKYLKK